ncbi:MAG: dicarboxylate/amino acid:cation symporter [Woeseiaceae bacterium]|nr:dicarboxylate/amino acid:cation symporter [Woeseiaceae bacterium]
MGRGSHLMLVLILLGVIAGGAAGWAYGPAAGEAVGWLGELFLNALTMLVVPLLVAAVVSGITSLGDPRKLGSLGSWTIIYYLATVGIAVLIGLVMVNLIRPGDGVPTEGLTADPSLAEQGMGVTDVLLSLVAPNIIDAAANTELLPIIVWSILLGVAIAIGRGRTRVIAEFFDGLNDAMLRIVGWVMYLAPLGIFGLVADRLGQAGGGVQFWQSVSAVGLHVVTVLAGLAVHFAVLLLILYWLGGRTWSYLSGMARAVLVALGTASSSATLPLTMQCAREQGVDDRAARFVLPLGSTINMDGTALYEAAAVLFIAQAYGIELGFGGQVLVFVTASLAAIGAAGIPEAGLVTMVVVLKAVGLPLEGVGLLLAVDWLLDRFRTATNVWGDAVGAAVIDRLLSRQANGSPERETARAP